MDAERWRCVEPLLAAALDLDEERRRPYLDAHCGEDRGLRAEVERLIAVAALSEPFLETPPWGELEQALGAMAASLPAPLAPGTVVGRYLVLEPVGEGGTGAVYAARDPELDRRVALKLVPAKRRSPERLLREAQTLARISHPHVVTVHDVGTHGEAVFIAMELVEGGTLADWLRAGERSWREVLSAFLQAARGLAAAHACGVVHRDFKPANVLRGRDGRLRVADFGLARAPAQSAETNGTADEVTATGGAPPLSGTATATATGWAMGTPSYMAPEQHTGGEVGTWTDQFSYCVALYQALYGEHPFGGGPLASLRERVLAGRLGPLPKRARIPKRLRAVLLRGLAVAPERRWRSMAELVAALERAASTGRRVSGAAAAAVALALGGVALVTLRDAGPPPPQSVAVMPFADLSPDPEDRYLGDGLADELITALGRVEPLRVPARTSVHALHDRGLTVAELGRRLGVAHVLEGTVRRSGDRLRVTARLIDVHGGAALWSRVYDRPVAEVFEVQEEIARAVADRLAVPVARDTAVVIPGTQNLKAYRLYLKGRASWNKRTEEGLRLAVTLFQRAIEEDAEYALAYSGLADAYALTRTYVRNPDPADLDRAREAAVRAVKLAPELAEAHASLGFVHGQAGDVEAAAAELRRAVTLDPRYAMARHWYGHLLVESGRLTEGIGELEVARRLDPASSVVTAMLAAVYYQGGRHEEALATELELRELDPSWAVPGGCITRNYIALRRYRDAVAAVAAMPSQGRSAVCWAGLAEAHHLLSDYPAELEAAQSGRRAHPRDPMLLVAEGAALGELGRFREVRTLVESVLSREAGLREWPAVYGIIGELRTHGHAPAARRTAERVRRWQRTQPAAEGNLIVALTVSAALLAEDRVSDAGRLIAEAVRALGPAGWPKVGLSRYEALGLLGWTDALRGRREEAMGHLRGIAELQAPQDIPPYPAMIWAALGEKERAFATLGADVGRGLVVDRNIHMHPGFRSLLDTGAYHRLAEEQGLPRLSRPRNAY